MYGIWKNNYSRVTDVSTRFHAGESDIFSSRIQEPNVLSKDIEDESDPIRKEPDRIHGLYPTTSLKKLLGQSDGTLSQQGFQYSQILADVLQTTCNPDCGGLPLYYPFLIVEAKSGKGEGNFDAIEVQTALPIRNALALQNELRNSEFNGMPVPGGPLCWFFSNIGESWRVYGCYMSDEDESPPASVSILNL